MTTAITIEERHFKDAHGGDVVELTLNDGDHQLKLVYVCANNDEWSTGGPDVNWASAGSRGIEFAAALAAALGRAVEIAREFEAVPA